MEFNKNEINSLESFNEKPIENFTKLANKHGLSYKSVIGEVKNLRIKDLKIFYQLEKSKTPLYWM